MRNSARPDTVKAAPLLRVRGAGLRLCIRPIAFGNALGNAIADGLRPTDNRALLNASNKAADPDYYSAAGPSDEGENRTGSYEKLRQSQIAKVHNIRPLPADQNALYLEPDQLSGLADAVKNGRSVPVGNDALLAFMSKVGINPDVTTYGSTEEGTTQAYYSDQSIKNTVDFLTEIGGGKLPVAVGFAKSGISGENAYRSILDYVGGYASDDTRYRLSLDAGSKSTGLFKYNDAGIVDLTQGFRESFTAIDSQLVANGYIDQQNYNSYQKRAAAGDYYAGDIRHDSLARARLIDYAQDDNAPARLRDGARETAISERRGEIIGAIADLAVFLPVDRLAAGVLKVGTRLAESTAELAGIFGRASRIEGELNQGILGFVPGQGLLANRKQLRDFYTEAGNFGYKVEVNESLTQAVVNHRTKTITLRSYQSELGTLTDEYSHIFNQAYGRGRYLPDDLAAIHQNMTGQGTRGFTIEENTLYHQLELLNLVNSNKAPSFVRAIPATDLRYFINQTRDVAKALGKL